jgi:hypothetical protein
VGSSIDNGIVLLSESSSWMDVLDVLASGMIGSRGYSAKAFFNSWTFCGHCESINCLTALLVAVVGTLDISPDGDDTMQL